MSSHCRTIHPWCTVISDIATKAVLSDKKAPKLISDDSWLLSYCTDHDASGKNLKLGLHSAAF